MWYASCSVAPHVMPATLPVPVDPAGSICGPVCSGTPSKPMAGSDALVVPVPAVEVAPELEVPVPVAAALLAAVLPPPLVELELDRPHAARISTQSSEVTVTVR